MKKEIIDFKNLSTEEIFACVDVITKIREERKKKQYEKVKADLQEMVKSTIDTIGLEETKRIVREINRDLRER